MLAFVTPLLLSLNLIKSTFLALGCVCLWTVEDTPCVLDEDKSVIAMQDSINFDLIHPKKGGKPPLNVVIEDWCDEKKWALLLLGQL